MSKAPHGQLILLRSSRDFSGLISNKSAPNFRTVFALNVQLSTAIARYWPPVRFELFFRSRFLQVGIRIVLCVVDAVYCGILELIGFLGSVDRVGELRQSNLSLSNCSLSEFERNLEFLGGPGQRRSLEWTRYRSESSTRNQSVRCFSRLKHYIIQKS